MATKAPPAQVSSRDDVLTVGRVISVAALAVGSAVAALVGFATAATYDPFRLTGPLPAIAFFALQTAIALWISRTGRVRSALVGMLVFLPLLVVAVVRGHTAAAWTAWVLGVVAGSPGRASPGRGRFALQVT